MAPEAALRLRLRLPVGAGRVADGAAFDAPIMLFFPLQQFSAGCGSAVRRFLTRAGAWARARPRLAAWLYPKEEETPDARYRAFNGWYFSNLHEQERMLADRVRMDFYHAAIARHIRAGDRVVDLGTGTGILAAFASRRGAAKVYALDHSAILEQAKRLAAANGIERVEFLSMHSTEFTVDEPVDVILHEQMGDCLFDESMVANVCDLRDRVLKPGGLVLPSRFELYCEPVMLREDRRVPFLWELDVHGFDYSSMERQRPQDPGYYRLTSSDRGLVDRFLGDPEPVVSIDLQTLKETELPLELNYTRTVTQAGRLDGHAVFFRAKVDSDLGLSTSPLDAGRAPHWGFRILRTEGIDFAAGDKIEVRLKIGRWPDLDSWRWSQVRHPGQKGGAAESFCADLGPCGSGPGGRISGRHGDR
jgi:protein arginine N-methyltransferase 1